MKEVDFIQKVINIPYPLPVLAVISTLFRIPNRKSIHNADDNQVHYVYLTSALTFYNATMVIFITPRSFPYFDFVLNYLSIFPDVIMIDTSNQL